MKRFKRTWHSVIAVCFLLASASSSVHAEGPYAGAAYGFFGWKVFGGYEPFQYVAAEVAYVNMEDLISAVVPDVLGQDREFTGFQYSVLGLLPVGSNAFFGRIGIYSWQAERRGRTVESGSNTTFGLGYQLKFGPEGSWRFRAELEWFREIGGLASVGLAYQFPVGGWR